MKRFFAVISLVMVLTVLLTGCPCGDPIGITPHTSEYELIDAVNKTQIPAGSTKANLYYDNTQSMYGYICNDTTMKSNFTIVCQNLSDVVKGYNSFSINALCSNTEKVLTNGAYALEWKDIGASGFSKFKQEEFYTFWETSKGSFDRDNGQYGPLQILFDSSTTPVNFDELNLFITDLAEQELNNKLLAERINDIVLERDDHSVAIYCIKSNFSGYASVPASGITDGGTVEMINNDNFSGVRPFYCIIVGPTNEVVSMCNSLDETLTVSGLVKNSDYFSAKILSKRGLKYTPITSAEYKVFSNLYVDEENKYHDYDQYQAGINFENTNLNFNVTPIHYDQVFGENVSALGGLYYAYDLDAGSLEKSTFGNAAINFVIPLSNLSDRSPADYVNYQLTKEMVKVYGYGEKEVVTTDEYGEEISETVYEWEEIDFQSLFNSSSPYMQEPVCEFWNNGETIDRVKNFATNEDLKYEEYPSDKLALYTVENESGALRVKLAFNNIDELAEKYELITIVCNINAKKELDTNIPQWIKDFNLSDSAAAHSGNSELYEKTAGLDDFYKFLIGDMSSASERDKFESKMTKNITDVVVTVKLDY